MSTIKVALVVNVMIGPNLKAGLGKESYEVAMGLYNRGALGKVFCYGVTSDCDLPSDKIVSFCQSRIKRLALKWFDRLHKRYPVIRGRRRTEQWMDASYARKITSNAGDILYCPKPIYPRTVRRAKLAGLKTLVETSVLHPRFNMDIVNKERKRLGIRGTSGYTDAVRVCNIEETLEQADHIFAWSNFLRDSYTQYGVPIEKFISVNDFSPPGVDVKLYGITSNRKKQPFIVLHLSSITVIKGVQYLLDAWERVVDEIEGTLLLAGPVDGDMRQILRKRSVKGVECLGRINNPLECYRRASVFVSPSVSDAGPRTVLESMACGVPAIVSNHCGVSELIQPDVNGMVYRYDDVEKLSALLKWSYYNQKKLQSMGKNAYETVCDYSVESYADDVWQRIQIMAGI